MSKEKFLKNSRLFDWHYFIFDIRWWLVLCCLLFAPFVAWGTMEGLSDSLLADVRALLGESERSGRTVQEEPSKIAGSLSGQWRPFSPDSPWNLVIPPSAVTHPDSDKIISYMARHTDSVRLIRKYVIPIWVVNSDQLPLVPVFSKRIFADWDQNRDQWSDVGVPLTREMWAEPTEDGHITIIDPSKNIAWEMSRFSWLVPGEIPTCTTFNVWDLAGQGVGDPYYSGWRWQTRGGRGSGFPIIAGMLRPEELAEDAVNHALVFTFPENRRGLADQDIFVPPACRSDGEFVGSQYPIEGMRFQLDPELTERDFDAWGLSAEAKIIARALQKYGMFLGDNGGAMALQIQMLGKSFQENQRKWDELFPGFQKSVQKIPTDKFRIVYTGEAIYK